MNIPTGYPSQCPQCGAFSRRHCQSPACDLGACGRCRKAYSKGGLTVPWVPPEMRGKDEGWTPPK